MEALGRSSDWVQWGEELGVRVQMPPLSPTFDLLWKLYALSGAQALPSPSPPPEALAPPPGRLFPPLPPLWMPRTPSTSPSQAHPPGVSCQLAQACLS